MIKDDKLLLVLGHSCSGTTFIANAMERIYGLMISHEKMNTQGTVDWTKVVNDYLFNTTLVNNYNWKYKVRVTRNPFKIVETIFNVEDKDPKSVDYRYKYIKKHFGVDLNKFDSPIERAYLSYLYWHKLIDNFHEINLSFKVENAEVLTEFLYRKGIIIEKYKLELPDKFKHKVNKKKILFEDKIFISDNTKVLLGEFCNRFGYSKEFNQHFNSVANYGGE